MIARSSRGPTLAPLPTKTPFATPQARDYRTGSRARWADPRRSRNLNDQIGGLLTPRWVEWLMGYPDGWTDASR